MKEQKALVERKLIELEQEQNLLLSQVQEKDANQPDEEEQPEPSAEPKNAKPVAAEEVKMEKPVFKRPEVPKLQLQNALPSVA